jgi:hypothetical protein
MMSGHFVADIGENADIGGGNNPDVQHWHRTYDIVRTILHTILNVRHRTFVNIVGATYDIVCPTYDIVGSGKSMSYTMSYVSENLRCRRFENVYRIRCRRYLSYTMSYVFA